MQKLLKSTYCALLVTGCAASLAQTEPRDPKLKTIGYVTGSLVDDETYDMQFRRGAQRACKSENYKVKYRGRQPPTLEGVTLPDSMFYWVVKCP